MGELIAFPRTSPSTPEHIPDKPGPLWREVAGRVLRDARHERSETLAQVAARAGVSVPYLSEIERGRKEPSSEVLAAVSAAVDLTLFDLAMRAARSLQVLDLTSGPRGFTPGRPQGPVALAS